MKYLVIWLESIGSSHLEFNDCFALMHFHLPLFIKIIKTSFLLVRWNDRVMPEPLSFNSIPMILEIRRILCLFQSWLLPGVLLSFELFQVISETDHRHNSFSCLFSDDRSCRVSRKRCQRRAAYPIEIALNVAWCFCL